VDNKSTIFRSLELIEKRISERLTVENLANAVYFSNNHYQRLFREIVGETVMEYVTKRKLTLAGRALLESKANIIDIALEHGYESREGFTRSFKAYMGISPMEYRKYGLTNISHKIVKEKYIMVYLKTTDEIIRELNNFIAMAKDTANTARKNEVAEYATFWNMIAETTDAYAEETKGVLDQINAITEHPDEITNRFAVIKIIEDVAFKSNLLAFNVGLTVSRGQPKHVEIQWYLCEKYLELAQAATIKSEKIAGFFNELSSLIFEDMRNAAVDKMSEVIAKGRSAVDSIVGYENTKTEISNLLACLSVPLDEITVSLLEDSLFKLQIISFAADIDICRTPNDKPLFDNLAVFKESLKEAVEFFQTLIKPEGNTIMERPVHKQFQDIAYQGNIMLFYFRSEIEKINCLLNDGQREAFAEICEKINDFIRLAHNSSDEMAFKPIAEMLYSIYSDMITQADILSNHGGAVRFLANEFKGLADSVNRRV